MDAKITITMSAKNIRELARQVASALVEELQRNPGLLRDIIQQPSNREDMEVEGTTSYVIPDTDFPSYVEVGHWFRSKGLSSRALHALLRNGVDPKKLLRMTKDDLLLCRNIGPVLVAEILEFQKKLIEN